MSRIGWKVLAVSMGVLALASVAAQAKNKNAHQDFYSIADIFAEPGPTGESPRSIEWSPDGSKLTFLLRNKDSDLADLYVTRTKRMAFPAPMRARICLPR
ncbi:MAG TPA: hypothetical protein VFH57_03445 [Gammaproteobacteria bacterium]|nr:hypothetical protein [Gammaproteobacteria bacterium]